MAKVAITKPKQCLAACCFPLTEQATLAQYNSPGNEFVRMHVEKAGSLADGLDLFEAFGRFASRVLRDAEDCGVTVIRDFTIHNLPQILEYDVFTLFAHYNKATQQIELFDGLVDAKTFVNNVPKQFAGIFDLYPCNSVKVRNELKKEFSNQVIAYGVEIDIKAFMLFYKQIIHNLRTYDINYIDCILKISMDLNKHYGQPGKNA